MLSRTTKRALIAAVAAVAVTVPTAIFSAEGPGAGVVPAAATACDTTLKNIWQAGVAQFTTAPCVVVPPTAIPGVKLQSADATQRCLLDQFAQLVKANDEAAQRYRARLLQQLLEQQAQKAATAITTKNTKPDLGKLVTDTALTPADLLNAMMAAATDDVSTEVRFRACGVRGQNGKPGVSKASSQPVRKAPTGARRNDPDVMKAYLVSVVNDLKKNLTAAFRKSSTVAVAWVRRQRGGPTELIAAITVNRENFINAYGVEKLGLPANTKLTAAQEAQALADLNAEVERIKAGLGNAGFTNVTKTGWVAGVVGGNHAEELIYYQVKAWYPDADYALIGATNIICAARCWSKLAPSTAPVYTPVTPFEV